MIATITPDLPKVLADAARRGIDLAVIDTSPRADRDCIEICRRADFVIVPVRPSVMDIPAVEETMLLIEKAGQRNKSVIVLNAVPSLTSEGEEAGEVLAQIGRAAPRRTWRSRRFPTGSYRWSRRHGVCTEEQGCDGSPRSLQGNRGKNPYAGGKLTR